MKKLFTLSIIIIVLLSAYYTSQSQIIITETDNTDLPNAEKKDPLSITVKKGQTKKVNLYVFDEYSYNFEIEHSKKIKKLNFRIEDDDGNILYDNAVNSFKSSVSIHVHKSQKISLIFITQPVKFYEKNNKSFDIKIKTTMFKDNLAYYTKN